MNSSLQSSKDTLDLLTGSHAEAMHNLYTLGETFRSTDLAIFRHNAMQGVRRTRFKGLYIDTATWLVVQYAH